MAIITEESDAQKFLPTKPTKRPKIKPSSPSPSSSPSNPNPFTFWFYFTISVSLLTFVFIIISSLFAPQDPKTWFLTLPTNLRNHYSNGRTIKVQTTLHSPSVQVFTIQDGQIGSSDNVLIVHGLGCSSYGFSRVVKSLGKMGAHAVALDLPGSGFSDKSETVIEEKVVGPFQRVLEIYREIKEKGLFWGFDQLVENGYVNYNYEGNEVRVSKVESVKSIELGPEEMGRVLGQVIESMGLAPVDLVLHDSAFGLGANWVSENLGFVRSLTLLDSAPNQTAFPSWVLELPVVREVVLGSEFIFQKVYHLYCSKNGYGSDVESHRLLLKGRNGRRSVVGMGKKMNYSFDIAEWGNLDGVKDLPMQVIWSSGWSEAWSELGRQVANVLPQATFVTHSGGRWPQEDTSAELAETIYGFVSKLPKPVKHAKEEYPIPDHIRQMIDEVKASDHHHGHSGHDHHLVHGHDHEAGYASAYGLRDEYS